MKVYACPENVRVPDFSEALVDGRYSMERADELDREFYAALKAELLDMGYAGPHTGQIVYFPYADGSAAYMVADAPRRMCLIHVPLHDAWSLPEWQTRGLTKKDVVADLDRAKRVREIFAGPRGTQ